MSAGRLVSTILGRVLAVRTRYLIELDDNHEKRHLPRKQYNRKAFLLD